MGWMVRRSNPSGVRFSALVQTSPEAHPASCTLVTRSFPRGKKRPGRDADTPQPLLVLWSRKSRAIPLLPLWAVWPVQSLSASARVHFAFFFFNLIQPFIYNNDPFFLQGLCCIYCCFQFVIACLSPSVASCISFDYA